MYKIGDSAELVSDPDEGNRVLKPKNIQHWYAEVVGWLTKYCPPGGN